MSETLTEFEARRQARMQAITTEEIAKEIEDIVDHMSSTDIMAVPGVYELLSEYLNNEAIENILDADELGEDDAP